MSESFTVRIITPTITREHHNVATISHEKGPLGHIALKNPDNKIIAFYKDSAYSAWYVVQDLPPRDHLGRFTKRK